MDEVQQFVSMCERAYTLQRVLIIQGENSRTTRALRAKFYRLRNALSPLSTDRQICERVSFKLTGRTLSVVPQVNLAHASPVSDTPGVSDGSLSSGGIPPGNRLND